MASMKAMAADVVTAVNLKLNGSALRNRLGGPGTTLLVMAMLLAAVPMSLPELVLGVVGVVAYLALSISKADQRKKQKSMSTKKVEDSIPEDYTPTRRPRPPQARRQEARPPRVPKQDFRQPSVMPVQAPSFSNEGWEAEVTELLDQIAPTKEGDELMRRLVRIVKQAIWPLIPEAEVTGFASGNPKKCRAFGVAVPDVDVVVNVSPDVLTKRLEGRMSKGQVMRLDARKLQKCAIRACTDQLVNVGGFKFRRSAFRGQEPKVTLMVPSSLGLSDEPIPLDFSVNTATPLHNAALLTECGQLEPRARELILLVHRWARDRGICHAAKGHLPPYVWSLLCIYFLQVGAESEGQLLPALDGFTASSGLLGGSKTVTAAEGKWAPKEKSTSSRTSAASLFNMFLKFYTSSFDWRNEAVSVRAGRRAPPALTFPLHVALSEDGCKAEVAPSIEDPFEPTRNLGTYLTAQGVLRLKEELQRAEQLVSQEASLSALLEPWAPPEREPLTPSDEQQGSGGESEEGSVDLRK